ncbi:response regulator [Desulfospira joergensenii]|uniref:response regulator n=1 Tax=Desulfospira joergensenii TaxID=53329 RepID=UPI0004262EEC|nr:response regulator [Desulfospira joergensenii]
MKILVIDDERPTLAMFRLFLTACGYEVLTAENGEQGMDFFASEGPDIVFTDIRMPGMDGLEVLRQIRESGSSCPVIIITGHGDMEPAMAALDLAASDFINKPVERTALNSALVRAEKQLYQTEPAEFSVTETPGDQCLKLIFSGRLSQAAASKLSAIDLETVPGGKALFLFKDNFSIDRHGVFILLEYLRQTAGSGVRIEMSGLSHNHIRFFEMAGVDKLASLVPSNPGETGL